MWARIANIILGLWLLIAPSLIPHSQAASDNNYIIGPVIITFSFIALWEATDVLRKWNYPFAAWLLLAPWVLGYEHVAVTLYVMATGIGVFYYTTIKVTFKNRYGGGWASLWKKDPEHTRGKIK